MSERAKFHLNRWNIIDVLILIAVISSILTTCLHDDDKLVNTGNTFGATMVTARYVVQIMRIVLLVKLSK